VRKSSYRRPITATGLKKMETGELDYFDQEVWADLNTGTLEQYFNEKTRTEGFKRSKFDWKAITFGILIGMAFAAINQYVGLKVGMIVSGAWFVVYLAGLALKWEPTKVNIAAGASTGASQTCVGLVFAFPAIYLLAMNPDYALADGFLIAESQIPAVWVIFAPLVLGSFLGVLYFTIFRRVWLVEDPLPVPGFEASVKLVDIANDIHHGTTSQASKTLKMVLMSTVAISIFTFLRDFPVMRNNNPELFSMHVAGKTEAIPDDKISILNYAFGGKYYAHGEVMYPHYNITYLSFAFIPIQFGIGWFMKFKTALLINLGTFFTWFAIVPLAIFTGVPIYIGSADSFIPATNAFMAYGGIAKIIAVGAILGGGITALVKMWAVFKTATKDIFVLFKKDEDFERTDFVKGKGWYEWPMSHIIVVGAIVVIGITFAFTLGGFPFLQSLMFGILLVFFSFFLGAIGVKVMGETGSTPVSGTSFIVVMLLILLFTVLQTETSTLIVMTLLGASIFGTALSLSSDIINDFKIGIYAGTRPYHLVKGELTAIPFGAIVASFIVIVFSVGLATGRLNLAAPQANTFAKFIQTILGGGAGQAFHFIVIGFFVGVLAELTTGMGTAFGLGMYLPLGINLPLIVGGASRDLWEKKWFEPKAKAENWTDKEKTFRLVSTYMIATGLIIGEALMGTVIALYLVIPLLAGM